MRWIALVVSLFVIGLAGAAETNDPGLQSAIDAYWNADFERAEANLDSLSPQTLQHEDLLLLHKYRGMCAMALGRQSHAAEAFARIIELEPTYKMNSSEVAPPIVQRFEEAQYQALKQAYTAGKQAYLAGEFRDAATRFETVLQLDPLNEHARIFRRLALDNADRSGADRAR